jgi:hypothetical protein
MTAAKLRETNDGYDGITLSFKYERTVCVTPRKIPLRWLADVIFNGGPRAQFFFSGI